MHLSRQCSLTVYIPVLICSLTLCRDAQAGAAQATARVLFQTSEFSLAEVLQADQTRTPLVATRLRFTQGKNNSLSAEVLNAKILQEKTNEEDAFVAPSQAMHDATAKLIRTELEFLKGGWQNKTGSSSLQTTMLPELIAALNTISLNRPSNAQLVVGARFSNEETLTISPRIHCKITRRYNVVSAKEGLFMVAYTAEAKPVERAIKMNPQAETVFIESIEMGLEGFITVSKGELIPHMVDERLKLGLHLVSFPSLSDEAAQIALTKAPEQGVERRQAEYAFERRIRLENEILDNKKN